MNHYREDNKELTPIQYSSAAIKVVRFSRPTHYKCFRIHWHDRIELIRIQKGTMNIHCGSQVYVLHPGELAFIPPRIPHHGYTLDESVTYDVLMFDVRSFYNESMLCQKYLPAIFDGRAKFQTVITHHKIIQCFDRICADWDSDSLFLTALLYQLLACFFEYSLVEYREKNSQNNSVQEMIAYIESHFSQDITTASLCEHFGYTATHFGRKFKEGTGLTPMNYLKIYRMEAAYKFLKSEKRTIGEIATLCGFSDPNYFTRCFKHHFGIAPSQIKTLE